jgi:myo-inositol-1-phosphate synthase
MIVGCGNCAKSLVEGIQYYNENPNDTTGLMYPDIGGYTAKDIQIVGGFDIDSRKVGLPIKDALRAKPNCAMNHVAELVDSGENSAIETGAKVYMGKTLDGVAPWMLDYPEDVSFRISDAQEVTADEVVKILNVLKVDILINYLPVGSEEASRFYIDAAIKAKCHVVNCIPTIISTKDSTEYEQKFIDAGLTVIGSDMRSAYGASRLSEVLQGSMLDAGLDVTQHLQLNMACGSTQGQETIRTGRTANTDFLNMSEPARLHNKHISKENVLKGQNTVRNAEIAGRSLFAGPSLTVLQKPGGKYVGSDNKVCNIDIVAYGFGGARYELTARLSVQDSPNSGGVVISAIRFCKVASEMGIVGYIRGASAWTQKTPPVQMTTADAKFECDALARRVFTNLTHAQLASKNPKAENLPYTFQDSKTDYE